MAVSFCSSGPMTTSPNPSSLPAAQGQITTYMQAGPVGPSLQQCWQVEESSRSVPPTCSRGHTLQLLGCRWEGGVWSLNPRDKKDRQQGVCHCSMHTDTQSWLVRATCT